jgi:O-antigen ligase
MAADRAPMSWGLLGLVAITAVMPLAGTQLTVEDFNSPYTSGSLAWMGLLILAAFSAALIDGIRRGRLLLPRTGLLIAAVLLAAGAVASATMATDRYSAVLGAMKVIVGALYFLTILLVVDSREKVRWLVAAFVAGALAAAAVAVLNRILTSPEDLMNYFMANRVKILALRGIEPDSPEEKLYKIRILNDFLGTFAHPNLMVSYLATALVVVVALIAGQLRGLRLKKSFTVLGSILLTVSGLVAVYVMVKNVQAGHGRAAMVGFLAGLYLLLVLGLVRRRLWKIILLIAPLLLVAVLLALAWGQPQVVSARSTLKFRADYWQASASLIHDHLYWGVGPENFSDYYVQYKLPTAPEEVKDPHNLFVWAWANLGLLGLLGVVTLIVFATREVLRRPAPLDESRSKEDQSWHFLVLAGLSILMVSLVLRIDNSEGEWSLFSFLMLACSLGFMAAPLVSVIGFGLEEDPPTRARASAWLRAGLVAALVTFGLQTLVATDFGEWPSSLVTWLLLGLIVATSDGVRRWQWPLVTPSSRALAGLIILVLLGGYSAELLRPVVTAISEIQGLGPDRTSEAYQAALERAKTACQWWPKSDSLMAKSCWFGMLAAQQREQLDLDRAARLPADSPLWRALLTAAEQEHAAALENVRQARENLLRVLNQNPRAIEPRRLLVQVDVTLDWDFGQAEVRQEAIESMREVVRLYPTNATFRAEFAALLERCGRVDEARSEAAKALELDGVMPDPERKLRADQREKCRRLAATAAETKTQ